MKLAFGVRLALDFMAACLLLAAMAYDATGNLLHELVGTAMFLLLLSHNIFNRRWYGTIAKKLREPRGLITRVVNLSLLVVMVSLVVTSVIISQVVFSLLPMTSTFTARQMHTLVGYMALIIAATHLGLHWTVVMGVIRNRLGITGSSTMRVYALRLLTAAVAGFGVHSLLAAGVGSKLLMRMEPGFDDLQTSSATILAQHAAIVTLFGSVAHYALRFAHNR